MKISLITVTYNSSKTLKDTFNSVLKQSHPNFEYIVVDGASKDDTVSIIKEYDSLFQGKLKWVSEPDNGLYDAMNKGIRMATGDIVGIINSDDYFTSNYVLQEIATTFKQNKNLDAIYGDIHFVHPDNLQKCVRYYSSKIFKRSLMRLGFIPAHPSFYIRRECFDKYGLYKTDYKIAADFEFLLRVIFKNNIRTKYLPMDMVTMRTGGTSTSGIKSHIGIMKEHLRAFKENEIYTNVGLLSLRYIYKIGEIIKSKMRKFKFSIILIGLLLVCNISKAQLTDGMTGLLHMANAEVQNDGVFMIGGNFLHKKNLPNNKWWGYDSYNYFINITIFNRIEISYICTLVQGKPNGYHWPEFSYGKFVNQDRHFASKIQLVKEGEWWEHMPAIAVGVSDPTTGGGTDYLDMAVKGGIMNGFFNRYFTAVTKHFDIKGIGELGIHATYLYNQRTDYPLNGIGWGINFRPDLHRNLNLIVEHDTKTLNVGALYSLWADHFNVLFELQDCKYISAGLVYKVNLKGGNRWKSKLFDY